MFTEVIINFLNKDNLLENSTQLNHVFILTHYIQESSIARHKFRVKFPGVPVLWHQLFNVGSYFLIFYHDVKVEGWGHLTRIYKHL